MRVPAARLSRSPFRAAALCAVLALAGCASKDPLKQSAPAAPVPAAVVQADAARSAAHANAGTTTTTVTRLQKFLWFFSPYRPTIQQGNFVSAEQLAQLKAGMTREQVRFVLGTALLQDIFHADRWDYPFRFERGNGELTTSRVTVYFNKEGKVDHFDGGNLPTERDYIAKLAGPLPQPDPPPGTTTDDTSDGQVAGTEYGATLK
jgi:outer membrane protein assembly factor BamE